jgi:hypothetical protein
VDDLFSFVPVESGKTPILFEVVLFDAAAPLTK